MVTHMIWHTYCFCKTNVVFVVKLLVLTALALLFTLPNAMGCRLSRSHSVMEILNTRILIK
jgi:hypothetical protein